MRPRAAFPTAAWTTCVLLLLLEVLVVVRPIPRGTAVLRHMDMVTSWGCKPKASDRWGNLSCSHVAGVSFIPSGPINVHHAEVKPPPFSSIPSLPAKGVSTIYSSRDYNLTCSSCTAPPGLLGSLHDGTTLTLRSRGRAEPLDLGMLSGISFSWEMPVASSDPSIIWKQRRFLEPGGYFVVLQSRAPRQGSG